MFGSTRFVLCKAFGSGPLEKIKQAARAFFIKCPCVRCASALIQGALKKQTARADKRAKHSTFPH